MDLQEVTRLYDFHDYTVVIPGGAGVLGSEMACCLVSLGANVAILDYEPQRAERIRDRLACGPGRAKVFFANVLERSSLLEARQAVLEAFGSVYGLINAAGGNQPQATSGNGQSFFDLPAEALRGVIDLNLLGTILPSQVFGEVMLEQGTGSIVNISSMNAYRPLTRTVAYAAAKAAVSNFTQWLAVHLAQEFSPTIRVNALAPGFFHTKQNHFLLYDEATGELTPRGRAIIEHTPMARFGDPEDLLGATLWLLSPASQFVTGTVIPIDGGFSAFSGV